MSTASVLYSSVSLHNNFHQDFPYCFFIIYPIRFLRNGCNLRVAWSVCLFVCIFAFVIGGTTFLTPPIYLCLHHLTAPWFSAFHKPPWLQITILSVFRRPRTKLRTVLCHKFPISFPSRGTGNVFWVASALIVSISFGVA